MQKMDIQAYWNDVLSKNRDALPRWFCDDAVIRWHCTNEMFSVAEFVKANCDYPGEWDGETERIERSGSSIILAGRVFPRDKSMSFHVVSFIRLKDDRISELDEYWADDGEAPAWRREMKIGKPIR